MNARLNILPDPAFAKLQAGLSDRLTRLGAEIHASEFDALLDSLPREVFRSGVAEAQADEGTIWLVDESGDFLEPAFNTGPHAAEIVGKFKQPCSSGLICMVFASEQPFLENEVSPRAGQSQLLDAHLQVRTTALIAVPFYFLNACRGVISCVQLHRPERPEPRGFRPEHLACIQRTASLVSVLIEHQLLSSAVGWKC